VVPDRLFFFIYKAYPAFATTCANLSKVCAALASALAITWAYMLQLYLAARVRVDLIPRPAEKRIAALKVALVLIEKESATTEQI